jgi:amidase
VPFSPVANVTGQPSMSVPLFWNNQGLPIGTMFTGRLGDEATLLRLASQLEAERPWQDRRPPIRIGRQ